MLHMIEHVFIEQSLVAAFAVVGAVMWISLAISKRFTAGRVHGSAIAIVMGLALAYGGGLMTAGQKGVADIPVFAGIGLMGGAMLRDFAIVATAFEVDVVEARKAGLLGVLRQRDRHATRPDHGRRLIALDERLEGVALRAEG